jgi:preprotein translocase subunit SecF
MSQPPVLDLVGKRHWFFLFSFIILLPGVISLLIPPSLKPGIDFSSGSTFTVHFEQGVTRDELRGALADLGHPEARVQATGDNEFLVRTKELRGAASAPPVGPSPPTERDAIESALRERFGNMVNAQGVASEGQGFLEFSSISATLSREIARNAGIAVIVASLAIFVYLWWSFRSVPQPVRFGAAAILALLHDVLFVVGIFSILGKAIDTEINSFFITALLTVIGFSVHDSIVVFDRIRETVARGEYRVFGEAVNASLLQTMGRSLNTSLTLIFAILALLLMGGGSIREFLWAMLAGTITGTYSSIFIASQILVSWDEGDLPRLLRRLFRRPAREKEYEAEPVGVEG